MGILFLHIMIDCLLTNVFQNCKAVKDHTTVDSQLHVQYGYKNRSKRFFFLLHYYNWITIGHCYTYETKNEF